MTASDMFRESSWRCRKLRNKTKSHCRGYEILREPCASKEFPLAARNGGDQVSELTLKRLVHVNDLRFENTRRQLAAYAFRVPSIDGDRVFDCTHTSSRGPTCTMLSPVFWPAQAAKPRPPTVIRNKQHQSSAHVARLLETRFESVS